MMNDFTIGIGTPSTPNGTGLSLLTPNTVKSIEQSILASLETQTQNSSIIPSAASGSFLPPLPQSHSHQQPHPTIITANNYWSHGNIKIERELEENEENNNIDDEDDEMMMEDEGEEPITVNNRKNNTKKSNNTNSSKKGKGSSGGGGGRGRGGGRKATRRSNASSNHTSDDEGGDVDEKRKIRRERNKLAAARCRKRRVDQTNQLMEETENLEQYRSTLQSEIQLYQQKKEEFEFILQAHLPICKMERGHGGGGGQLTVVTTSSNNNNPHHTTITSHPHIIQKPKRPTTLPVGTSSNNTNTTMAMSITTPSNGLLLSSIGFESVEWGTGLTPTTSGNVAVVSTSELMTPMVNTPGRDKGLVSL